MMVVIFPSSPNSTELSCTCVRGRVMPWMAMHQINLRIASIPLILIVAIMNAGANSHWIELNSKREIVKYLANQAILYGAKYLSLSWSLSLSLSLSLALSLSLSLSYRSGVRSVMQIQFWLPFSFSWKSALFSIFSCQITLMSQLLNHKTRFEQFSNRTTFKVLNCSRPVSIPRKNSMHHCLH